MRSPGRWVCTRIATVVIVTAAVACSSVRTDVLQLGPPQEPRTDPEQIVVYAADDARAPQVPPNIKVGEITASNVKKPLAAIIAKMKEDASDLGADALVIHKADTHEAGTYYVRTTFASSRPRMTNSVKATAIRLSAGQ